MEQTTIWYNYDLSDMKEVIKCVKHIERICRLTLEYDIWQMRCKYKDNQDCPICEENYYEKNLKIESHHHPKTLFDIVQDVITENLESNLIDEKTGIDLVQEVMDLHFFDKVSYINLCVHCHKKYHDGHPDVINKMSDIFEKRALAGQEKYEKSLLQDDEIIQEIEETKEIESNKITIPDSTPMGIIINIDDI
ncbi:MAG: hypothetical protein WC136_00395 [Sphaerochaeta sp.]|jgi:hypothetical protein